MIWPRFLLAVVLSGIVASFTDWLFMGVLFHKKYLETPEIWRLKAGENETRGIVLSSLLGVLSCAVLLYFFIWVGIISSHAATFHSALLLWAAAPYRSFLAISFGLKCILSWAFPTRWAGSHDL
jgi:hypothetical protein